MSAPDILALALVAILGSAAQSATGFGVALPVAPVAFVALTRRRRPHRRGRQPHAQPARPRNPPPPARAPSLRRRALSRCRLPGLILGALVVSHVSKPLMQLTVGVAILGAIVFRLHEPGRVALLSSRASGLPTGLL